MGLVTRDLVPMKAASRPCADCPWRIANAGKHALERFPATLDETTTWGCHSSPTSPAGDSTLVCAGFLAAEDENWATSSIRAVGLLPSKAEAREACSDETFRTFADMMEAQKRAKGERHEDQ